MVDGLKRGMNVRAFHPAKFGVINHGTITKIGSRYVYVDFGNDIRRVNPMHIVEVVERTEVGEDLGTA